VTYLPFNTAAMHAHVLSGTTGFWMCS
jgi:hypothetical protein